VHGYLLKSRATDVAEAVTRLVGREGWLGGGSGADAAPSEDSRSNDKEVIELYAA